MEDLEVAKSEPPKNTNRYKIAVSFIITFECCMGLYAFGKRAVLVLYFSHRLGYSEEKASVVFHSFGIFGSTMPILGAMIADSWLGRYKTISYFSLVYVFSSVIMLLGSIPPLNLPVEATTMIALMTASIGGSGISPCLTAFGGDQFKMPEQQKNVATYFSILYFSINIIALISILVTPILRHDVQCFDDQCYALAFGAPAVFLYMGVAVFIFGKPFYNIYKPLGQNMLVLVAKCICYAIRIKRNESKVQKRDHWLDYAGPKYNAQIINDTKVLLNILVVCIPIPVFWSLFDQQGSRWTFQATRMDGDIGFYVVKPDQVTVVNPLLVLLFIPLFELVFYPLLSRIGIRRPLQRMIVGGFLASLAFVCSGILEMEIKRTQDKGTKPLSILWILPQYVIMTLGEIMFSVTMLGFSYAQAPVSMKSVLQAVFGLTMAFGSGIDVIVMGFVQLKSQANEFFLFAGLMFIDMLIFIYLAYRYVPSINGELDSTTTKKS